MLKRTMNNLYRHVPIYISFFSGLKKKYNWYNTLLEQNKKGTKGFSPALYPGLYLCLFLQNQNPYFVQIIHWCIEPK
jgi:hypothetical protein